MYRSVTLAIAMTFCAFVSTPAIAESSVEDIVKYRHAVMELMAGHMSALALIAQGKVDQGQFTQNHADALASATQELGALFPVGSGGEDSHSLPAIWENPEEFQKAIDKAAEAGAGLSKTAAEGDPKATMGAFAALGKSCKGCHESYREEHDH